ncbi:MAG: RNA-protein complex protein Nop10 [Candidatus Altiarchaeota archaeon]|nr:RNA-protein complex protein Nop10 [Candidatus Altiarchaeota archaeon]
MKTLIKVCPKCRGYTLRGICPKCDVKTMSAAPPKFSPEDKYGDIRREEKFL